MAIDHTTGSDPGGGESVKPILHSGHFVFVGLSQGTNHGLRTRGGSKVWMNPSVEATYRRPEEHIRDRHFSRRGFSIPSDSVKHLHSSCSSCVSAPVIPTSGACADDKVSRDWDVNFNDRKIFMAELALRQCKCCII